MRDLAIADEASQWNHGSPLWGCHGDFSRNGESHVAIGCRCRQLHLASPLLSLTARSALLQKLPVIVVRTRRISWGHSNKLVLPISPHMAFHMGLSLFNFKFNSERLDDWFAQVHERPSLLGICKKSFIHSFFFFFFFFFCFLLSWVPWAMAPATNAPQWRTG